MKKRISVVTSRGSHVQYAPQTGLAHSGPVVRMIRQNATPSSIEDEATISQNLFLLTRYIILAAKATKNAINEVQANET